MQAKQTKSENMRTQKAQISQSKVTHAEQRDLCLPKQSKELTLTPDQAQLALTSKRLQVC